MYVRGIAKRAWEILLQALTLEGPEVEDLRTQFIRDGIVPVFGRHNHLRNLIDPEISPDINDLRMITRPANGPYQGHWKPSLLGGAF